MIIDTIRNRFFALSIILYRNLYVIKISSIEDLRNSQHTNQEQFMK